MFYEFLWTVSSFWNIMFKLGHIGSNSRKLCQLSSCVYITVLKKNWKSSKCAITLNYIIRNAVLQETWPKPRHLCKSMDYSWHGYLTCAPLVQCSYFKKVFFNSLTLICDQKSCSLHDCLLSIFIIVLLNYFSNSKLVINQLSKFQF